MIRAPLFPQQWIGCFCFCVRQTSRSIMFPLLCMASSHVIVYLLVLGLLKSSSILLLSIALFVGSLGCFGFLSRSRSQWPVRNDIWFVARWMFVFIWFFSLIGYSLFFFAYPQNFAFPSSKLWFVAPIISVAPAIMSTVLTMCAGDTMIFILKEEDSVH